VPDSWVTSKQAVNFFSTWCAARSWVFQPVDASNDFGKDGYVDITDDDGTLTGDRPGGRHRHRPGLRHPD
jgi:hypothetical protein